MSSLIFDIETEGLPEEQLKRSFVAPDPNPHPGVFDSSSVKLGNLGEEKAKAKIAAEKEKHEKAAKDHEKNEKQRLDDAFAKYVADAALSPLTGRILCVGLMNPNGTYDILEGEEADVLQKTLNTISRAIDMGGLIIGCCSNTFDLPFIIKRAWVHDLMVPERLIPRPYWPNIFVDLNQVWQLGGRGMNGTLDDMAKFFGVQGKLEWMDGSQFASTYRSGADGRLKALEYLRCDLKATLEVANKMQVL